MPVRVWWVRNYFKLNRQFSSHFHLVTVYKLYSNNIALNITMLLKHVVHLHTYKKTSRQLVILSKIICPLNRIITLMNSETSILGTPYTMMVTISGYCLSMNGSFWVENELHMSQNSKLLNLTSKATIKQCEYNSKTVKSVTFLIIHAPVHDGKNGIITLIFT